MDFNLKQWRKSEVDEETPTLYLDSASSSDHSTCALPLFVSEPLTKLSDSTATPAPPKFTRMGSNYFSLEQLQELELQALIYRHFIAGAPVPPELLHLVKKSIINSTPSYYFSHPFQQYPHYQVQQALMQSGYWGRAAMDPEPGRCRRTDGKKWRCSRDVVAGQKYCERHVHRGRSRSRKPVEIPTPANSVKQMNNSHSNLGKMPGHATTTTPHFSLSGPSPSNDLLHLNQRPYESMKGPIEARKDDGKSSGQILRHFFDDWPRQGGNGGSSSNSVASATDFSLKLSTGNDYDPGVNVERSTWGTNHVGSMGGPLAEALRSPTTNLSPTSVLHQLPHCNIST